MPAPDVIFNNYLTGSGVGEASYVLKDGGLFPHATSLRLLFNKVNTGLQVVMAFEDEFAIEIPDAEAEKIFTVSAAVDFIAAHPQAK